MIEELKVSKGTIARWAKKAMNDGWLRKKGREYELVDGNEDFGHQQRSRSTRGVDAPK
jgi:hypothetical protein